MKHQRISSPAAQGGAALAVVLILLVVMILIGLASLRGTLMEQRMSTSMLDRSMAFQATEAALRQGESVAAGKPSVPAAACKDATSCCKNGICRMPDPSQAADGYEVWKDAAVWASAPQLDVKMDGLAAKPRYIVELLADDVPPKGSCTTSGDISETSCSGSESRYRITARSSPLDAGGKDGRAEVVLQSIFAVP